MASPTLIDDDQISGRRYDTRRRRDVMHCPFSFRIRPSQMQVLSRSAGDIDGHKPSIRRFAPRSATHVRTHSTAKRKFAARLSVLEAQKKNKKKLWATSKLATTTHIHTHTNNNNPPPTRAVIIDIDDAVFGNVNTQQQDRSPRKQKRIERKDNKSHAFCLFSPEIQERQ